MPIAFPLGVEQHPGRACRRADTDEQRPEQQDTAGSLVS